MTASGMLILVPQTEGEEEEKIYKMIERSVLERRASNLPYLKDMGPSALEL